MNFAQRSSKVTDFGNRSVFDEVMPKTLLVRCFSGHGVFIILSRYINVTYRSRPELVR